MSLSSDITKNNLRLFLYTPNRESLGEISLFMDDHHRPEVGVVSQLDFSIPYYEDYILPTDDMSKPNTEKVKNRFFDLIKERYLLKVKWFGNEEWYIIDDIISDGSADETLKRITAYSLPYEMRGVRLFDWAGVLVDGEYRKESLTLRQMAEDLLRRVNWELDWIDPDLLGTNQKYRFFDLDDNSTVLEGLYEVAKEFNAIIVFDTENRKLSFRHEDNYGRRKNELISRDNYLKAVQDELKPNDIVTIL